MKIKVVRNNGIFGYFLPIFISNGKSKAKLTYNKRVCEIESEDNSLLVQFGSHKKMVAIEESKLINISVNGNLDKMLMFSILGLLFYTIFDNMFKDDHIWAWLGYVLFIPSILFLFVMVYYYMFKIDRIIKVTKL